MISAGTLCGLLLLGVLWVDLAMAGSSFLSPEHHKAQVSPLPPGPRSDHMQALPLTEQPCHLREGSTTFRSTGLQTERPGGLKKTSPSQQRKESKKLPAKLQPRALEDWFRPEGRGQVEAAEDELEIQFNAPFDVGIKLSGAQYQQHSQALGKFLQDILGEEAKEAAADK